MNWHAIYRQYGDTFIHKKRIHVFFDTENRRPLVVICVIVELSVDTEINGLGVLQKKVNFMIYFQFDHCRVSKKPLPVVPIFMPKFILTFLLVVRKKSNYLS